MSLHGIASVFNAWAKVEDSSGLVSVAELNASKVHIHALHRPRMN